jgi:hypothetical protein
VAAGAVDAAGAAATSTSTTTTISIATRTSATGLRNYLLEAGETSAVWAELEVLVELGVSVEQAVWAELEV